MNIESRFTPLFNADGGAGGGTSEPAGTNADSGGNAGNVAGEPSAQSTESKPFAVFPDEASFMGRVSREAKKQVNEFLKSLGVEKEDELKQILSAHREGIEKSKSELDKAREAAAKAQKERDEFVGALNTTLKLNEAKVQALANGIKPERLDYVLKLVDLSEVEVKDGAVDSKAVEGAISKVLKDFPELRATNQVPASKGGQDFSNPAAQELLTLESVKAMSVEEVERRLPDIMKLLERK